MRVLFDRAATGTLAIATERPSLPLASGTSCRPTSAPSADHHGGSRPRNPQVLPPACAGGG
eukprot:8822593-Alexandrium_andersonii.AAC.1